MASDARSFVFKFFTDTNEASKGFRGLSRDLEKMGDDLNKGVGRALSNLVPSFKQVAVAGAAALAGTAAFLYKAAEAAAEDQKSQALLERQLKLTVGASDLQIKSLELGIGRMQLAAGVSEDVLRPALASLVRTTGDLSKAQSILRLALDVSAGTGKDLESVSLALAKTYLGNFTALTRMGVPLDENIKKTKDFDAVSAKLNEMFGGASQTAANTFIGGMARLRLGIGEVVEKIGTYLLPYLTRFVGFLNDKIVPALQLAADNFGQHGLSGALTYFVAALGNTGTAAITIMENISLAILKGLSDALLMMQRITEAGTIINALAGNAVGVVKLAVATEGLAALRGKVDDFVGGLPQKFDDLRLSVSKAAAAISMLGRPPKDVSDALDRMGVKGQVLSRALKTVVTDIGGGGGGGGVSKTLETVSEKLKKFTAALDKSASSSKALARAGRDVLKAQEGLGNAAASLAAAQLKRDQALKGFGVGSPQAIEAQIEFDKAQRGVERSGYAVEEAGIAVARAELRLQEIRKDPLSSPADIREAEIALAEAKLTVADSLVSQRDATIGLNSAQMSLNETTNGAIVGGALWLEVTKDLADAEDARADAAQRVTDAIDAQTDAIKGLNEALKAQGELAKLYPGIAKNNPMASVGSIIPVPSIAPAASVQGGSSVNIEINSLVADSTLPQVIVDALQTYNKRVGPLRVQVA